jgi:hypothetical protein
MQPKVFLRGFRRLHSDFDLARLVVMVVDCLNVEPNENDHQGRGVDSTRVSVADRDLWCIVLFWLLVRTRTRTQSDRTVLVLDCYAGRLYHSVLVDARVRFEFAMGMNEWVSDSRPAG